MKKSMTACLCWGLVLALYPGVGCAQWNTLLTEDWSQGLNPSKWDVENGSGNIHVVDVEGDNALSIIGGSTAWDTWIYSVDSWPRGGDLRCTFRVWHPVYPSWSFSVYLLHFGGPWHWSNSGPSNQTLEAGLDGSYAAIIWNEALPYANTSYGWNMHNHMDVDVYDTLFNATSRDSSVLLRVTLGNTRGGMLEVSTDDGANWFVPSDNTAFRPVDTREKDIWEGSDDFQQPTGNRSPNWFGFGPRQAVADFDDEQYYVDDIVVESTNIVNEVKNSWLLLRARYR